MKKIIIPIIIVIIIIICIILSLIFLKVKEKNEPQYNESTYEQTLQQEAENTVTEQQEKELIYNVEQCVDSYLNAINTIIQFIMDMMKTIIIKK